MKLAEATFIGEVADAVWVDWDMGFSEAGGISRPARSRSADQREGVAAVVVAGGAGRQSRVTVVMPKPAMNSRMGR